MSGLFNDAVTASVQRALDGVSAQQRMTAANISNAMTPGYKAQRVDFETNLQAALADGTDPSDAALDQVAANTPADATGNTVQLDTETMDLNREGLRYQALTQALNFRLGLYKTAISG